MTDPTANPAANSTQSPNQRATATRIPRDSLVFGFGPMLPLAIAAVGAWALPLGWAVLAVRLSVIWGAMILVFVGGVRRGFGFGVDRVSTPLALVSATIYLVLAGLALVVPAADTALALLVVGFALVAELDRRAALRGDAPAHFARLRPPQMLIGAAALVVSWAWTLA